MLRLAFDFIITWRETRTRPNAYSKKELLRQWSQGSTASLAAWRLSANGMEKRE